MTSFGKGSRMCLGINLAYAEIMLLLSSLFRNFEFSLYQTDELDVACCKDTFGPTPKAGSKGVRVTVQSI